MDKATAATCNRTRCRSYGIGKAPGQAESSMDWKQMQSVLFAGAHDGHDNKSMQVFRGQTNLLASPICQGIAGVQTALRLLSQCGQDLHEAYHLGGHAAWAGCGRVQPPHSHHPPRKMLSLQTFQCCCMAMMVLHQYISSREAVKYIDIHAVVSWAMWHGRFKSICFCDDVCY